MKKDYVAVKAGESGLSEKDFISQHWTKAWEKSSLDGNLINEVARRDEFRQLKRFLKRLSAGARIVDAGCGRGEWTVMLRDLGYDSLGIDISASTVKKLCSIFGDKSFLAGDIRKTGLESDLFDAVISWGTFEHFENGLQDCFREAWRILKPGGLLAITVPYYNLRHRFSRKPGGITAEPPSGMRFYQWRLTRSELRREFEMGGFDVFGIVPIHKEEGAVRLIHSIFRIHAGSWMNRMFSRLLAPLLPADFIAHMLFGAGGKQGHTSKISEEIL